MATQKKIDEKNWIIYEVRKGATHQRQVFRDSPELWRWYLKVKTQNELKLAKDAENNKRAPSNMFKIKERERN